MKRLGVNIDHVATLRNARGELHPDPVVAAKLVKKSLEFVNFRADFYRNFTRSCRINKNYQILAENCEIL